MVTSCHVARQAPGSGQCLSEPPADAAFVSVTSALTEGTGGELTLPFIQNAHLPLGVPMGMCPWEGERDARVPNTRNVLGGRRHLLTGAASQRSGNGAAARGHGRQMHG